MVYNVILVIHVVIAASVVALVLLQQGKGADVGAAFGSGASSTVFGSRGSGSFLTRLTGILAALFFVTSLSLAYLASQPSRPDSVLDSVPVTSTVETPADIPTDAGDAVVAEPTEVPPKPADAAREKTVESDVPVTD
jgi:preprotein translocase subunit SecG